ncbi:MAG: FliM/FliN family flagellar motor switch protein [Phycisphaerae bacterium]
MTDADTLAELENAVETSDPTQMPADAVSPQAQEPTPSVESAHPHFPVTHINPALVEPASKDLKLPDTPQMRRIRQVEVPIIVRLAHKIMPLGEIMQLAPGAIIEFNKVVGDNLDLMINNKGIGGGQAVKVGEKFGLRVTNLTTLDQMILAMAGK